MSPSKTNEQVLERAIDKALTCTCLEEQNGNINLVSEPQEIYCNGNGFFIGNTNEFNTQKSLGAKRFFILFQFLVESVMLCVTGGAIGLLLIFILTILAQYFGDISLFLSLKNILMGLAISSLIGLVCGIAPALAASRLDPVEAIRAN